MTAATPPLAYPDVSAHVVAAWDEACAILDEAASMDHVDMVRFIFDHYLMARADLRAAMILALTPFFATLTIRQRELEAVTTEPAL